MPIAKIKTEYFGSYKVTVGEKLTGSDFFLLVGLDQLSWKLKWSCLSNTSQK